MNVACPAPSANPDAPFIVLPESIRSRQLELSQEAALAEVEQLSGMQMVDNGGLTVYSGFHANYGPVFIVIPPMGMSFLLLPFDCLY